MAFTQDNQSAFISDRGGKIKIIKWKPNVNTDHDFDFTQNNTQGGNVTIQICLTRDDKNLLVGSNGLVSIFNTRSRKLINQFKLHDVVYTMGIKLICGRKSVVITIDIGVLKIINLESMKMSPSHKNVTNSEKISTIALI